MSGKPNRVCINIAEFKIELFSERKIDLEEGYLPFIDVNDSKITDFTIECIEGLPILPFNSSNLVFEAENESQKFYSVYKFGQGLGFVIYNQQTVNDIQQIAVLDESFGNWKIFAESKNDIFMPLRYPMGPIMMHYMTLKTNSVLMHASSAFDGTKARLFSGFSGAGKSTISMLWAKAGHQIINDDRLIIRKLEDGFYVYNTPMYYQDQPKKAPLSSIFLISHSPENKIKWLNGAVAVSKVMAFSIQNNYDRQFIQSRIDLFAELCSKVSVYELGFVPDESVVKFVLEHEAGENK